MLNMSTDRFVHAYKLLAALAMENLAKGLVITKRRLEIKNHKLPTWFLKHDIVSLLQQKASFQLNEQEKRALDDCTKAIIWQTRYPMPNKSASLSRQSPIMDLGQRFNHPVDFKGLGTRILCDYSDKAFPTDFVSASDLIQILKDECPKTEALNSKGDSDKPPAQLMN